MSDAIEVIDQNGNRKTITREEFLKANMDQAKANWDNVQLLRQIGQHLIQMRFIPEALELFSRCAEISEGHVVDVYWRSVAQTENGNLDEAASGFAELQEDAAYPADQARAAIGLARVKARQGKPDEILPLIEWAVETDPENPELVFEMYSFHTSRENPESALEKVKTLAEKHPERVAPHRALGHIAMQQQNKPGVLASCYEALRRTTDPNTKQILYAECSTLMGQSGQPDEVVKLLEPLGRKLLNVNAIMNLAQAYWETSRTSDGIRILKEALLANPDNNEARQYLQQKLQQLETGPSAEEVKKQQEAQLQQAQ